MESKDAVLRAVAAAGYDELRAGYSTTAGTSIERMRERAAAYVEFARNRPELFRLMFMFRPNAIAIEADNELGAATDVFEAGLDDVRQAIADGSLVDRDPIQITRHVVGGDPWRRHGVDRGPASCRCGSRPM